MPPPRRPLHRHEARAFTIVEVLVATLLIALSMGSILAMNAKALSTLRESREAAASSQVLQQRVEMIRDRAWAEVSSARALAALLSLPTESEAELSDADLRESWRVVVPQPSAQGPVESDRAFAVRRNQGAAVIEQTAEFSAEPTLLFEGTLVWHNQNHVRTRVLRTIICRQGLTRSGIVGSVLGRPGTER